MSLFKRRHEAKKNYQDYLNYQSKQAVHPEELGNDSQPDQRYWNEYQFAQEDWHELGGSIDQEREENLFRDPMNPLEDSSQVLEEAGYLNPLSEWTHVEEADLYQETGHYRRAKYSAKIDHFLNNGILITGVLLLLVLLIAFLA